MVTSPKGLPALLDQIELVDQDILKLLEKRFALAKKRASLLGLSSDQVAYNPDEEAMAVRMLLKKSKGIMGDGVLVKIWREILSVCEQIVKPFSIAVYTKERSRDMIDLAKDYFGTNCRYFSCVSVSQAMQKVDTGEVGAAILPLFEQSEESWWTGLGSKEHRDLMIVAKLPFIKGVDDVVQNEGFVVSKSASCSTGNDRSLIAIEMSVTTSIGSLKSIFENVGFRVTQVWPAYHLSRIYLFAVELEGYITLEDDRMILLQSLYEKNIQMIRRIGGYATQQILKNK